MLRKCQVNEQHLCLVYVCVAVWYIPEHGGRAGLWKEAGPIWICVSTLKGNGLVIYGHGLRKKKKTNQCSVMTK